jgi:hypothetical protein
MRVSLIGLVVMGLMGNALAGVTLAAPSMNNGASRVLEFKVGPNSFRHKERKDAKVVGDIKQELRVKKIFGSKEVVVQREAQEGGEKTEDFLLQNGSKLIAEGDYKRVLDLIRTLPEKTRNNIQILTLESFANLKGWVAKKDRACQANWSTLRTELIKLGDNEATPVLLMFLKDKDPYLRVHAAEVLSHIGDKRALKDLREKGENDENSQVRKNAKWAYEQISGEKFRDWEEK